MESSVIFDKEKIHSLYILYENKCFFIVSIIFSVKIIFSIKYLDY